ncbi:hypothetical protein [[Mycoplasma] mobile]|uniref:hypothetical protein n=1 Tax=[Mycoplasma] mobile TaxID=2118 RepID=UPI00059D5649|nr:hypothetical protein [[Mycoplasma] mobile]
MENNIENRKNYKKKYIELQIISYRIIIFQMILIVIGFIMFFIAYSSYTRNQMSNSFFGFLIFTVIFLFCSFINPFIWWLIIKIRQNNMKLLSSNWKRKIKSFLYSYLFKKEIWSLKSLIKIMNQQDKDVMN